MALPSSFSNESNPIMSELDANFAALGAISYVPCTASGTNTITLTPKTNTPAINGYSQLQGYPFVATTTNTGSVQIQVLGPSGSPLTLLQAYKLSSGGPTPLTSGDIQLGSYYIPVYDLALNSGVGGFHLVNVVGTITSTAQPNTVYAGPTSSSPTAPTFRRLIGADLPNPSTTTLGGVLALQSQVSQFVTAILSSGQPITAQVFFSNIGGQPTGTQLPLPTLTTLGGVLALNSASGQFVVAIASSGQPQTAQIFYSNIAGSVVLPLPTLTALGGVLAVNSSTSQFVNAIASSGQPQTAQVFYSNLAGAPVVSAGTFTSATINGTTITQVGISSATLTGGTINSVIIGGATPGPITGTTITANTAFRGTDVGSGSTAAVNYTNTATASQDQHVFKNGGSNIFVIATANTVSSSGNYIRAVANIAGGGTPYLEMQGPDLSIPFAFNGKNSTINFYTETAFTNRAFSLAHTSGGGVNYLQVVSSAASGGPILSVQGTDPFAPLTLQALSSGNLICTAVFNNTTATAANVAVDSGGQIRKSTSSLRYKTQIENLEIADAVALLDLMRPVTFVDRREFAELGEGARRHVGFIAEEMNEVFPPVVFHNTVGDPDWIAYDRLAVVFQAAIKQLAARISALASA